LACLTRYEAWPVTIGSLTAALWVLWRRGVAVPQSMRAIASVATYPLVAIIGFSVFSRVVVGSWFANGFFVPENPAQGRPLEAVSQTVWGLRELSGNGVLAAGVVGALVLVGGALLSGAVQRAFCHWRYSAWQPCPGAPSSTGIPTAFATWCRSSPS
jgi:hypothetical protein